jgi:MFS family permease
MSTSKPVGGLSPDAFSSLFQAITGLRNRRALSAMVGCLCAGVLVFGLCSFLAMRLGFFMAFLGGLALFVAGAAGINAAGVLLMDQAKGAPSRGAMDAVVDGLMCIPKFVLLGLALLAVALGVWIVIALLYVVCKIPVLGPVLFVVVFPASVVVSGLTVGGLFVCLFLALPAIWEGSTVTHAVAQVLAIARSRLVESLVLLAVVGLLSAVVGFIVFGVLFAGLMPSIGLSASILGGSGLAQMMGMMRGGAEFGDMGASGAGYAIAAGIGAGLLWALAGSLVSLVNLMGLNLVYLRVTEGLDTAAAEAALTARLAEAKRQAAELGQKAKDAADRAREQARQSAAAAQASAAAATAAKPAAAASAAVPVPPRAVPREAPSDTTMPSMKKMLTCPQCLSAIAADDVFCGVCGYKLK